MSPPVFSPELCRVSAAKLASPKPKLAPPRTRRRYTSDGATHMPRGSGRLGDAPLPSRRGGFAPRVELAFGDSASLQGIRGAVK